MSEAIGDGTASTAVGRPSGGPCAKELVKDIHPHAVIHSDEGNAIGGLGTGEVTARPDADGPFTAFTDDAPRSQRRQATDFFNRPRNTVVHLAVCPGPATDRRPTPARDCHVIDYPDGRYLVRHNDSVLRADPADTPALLTHLQSALTATITAFREDATNYA